MVDASPDQPKAQVELLQLGQLHDDVDALGAELRATVARAHSPYGTQSRIINIGEQSKPTKMTGWPGQTEAAEVVVTSMATKHFRCHSILPRTKGCCLPVIFLKSGHSEKERLPNKQG